MRAAVADRRFVCVHFHDGVVHAHRPKRGEYVLDGMHADGAFAYRRGALDHLQILDLRIDGWLVLQIFTFEFDSVVHRCGMKFERDLFARVQRGASKPGNFAKRLLKFGRRHRALK